MDKQTVRPRFMTDAQLREHFGLTERALSRLKAVRDFPRKDALVGRTDSKLVDRFFDVKSGLESAPVSQQPKELSMGARFREKIREKRGGPSFS